MPSRKTAALVGGALLAGASALGGTPPQMIGVGVAIAGEDVAAARQSGIEGTSTVMLSVPDMSCMACPITVRKSLERLAGVLNAEVTLETKTAIVTFDPTKARVSQLITATTNVGFPSTLME